jgi:Mitochondrial carrier protein
LKNFFTARQAPAPAALAGGCAGVFSVMLTNPVDVVKTHMQAIPLTARSGGSLVAVRELLASEGLGAFARGLSARAWKIGLGQAVIFGAYDVVRSRL